MFNVKDMSKSISRYLSTNSNYRNIKFTKYEDRSYCSYVSDELSGIFLNGFGGEYESSITFSYSEGLGLQVEVYISNSKARRIGSNLVPVIKEEMMDGFRLSLSTTRFVPGDTSMTFTIGIPYSSQSSTDTAMNILANLTCCIALSLARY